MKNKFLKRLESEILVLDGATGTMLQKKGMKPGSCPEELNLSNPAMIKEVHKEYIEAGVDIITSNTFGGNRIKLSEYGLEGRLKEINTAAVSIAKKAAGKRCLVMSTIGPTGKFLQPIGNLSFDETYKVFKEQIAACVKAGADIIGFETFSDIKEIRAGIIAARDVSPDIPILAMMTFQPVTPFEKGGKSPLPPFEKGGSGGISDMRTVVGTDPETACVILNALGADLVGGNCSLGPEGLIEVFRRMNKISRKPLVFEPNAGMPELCNGITCYPASPETMAEFAIKFAKEGVNIIGGCCGTTPGHIKKIVRAVKKIKPKKKNIHAYTAVSSRTKTVFLGYGNPPNPPLEKGGAIIPPFRKGEAIIPPFRKGGSIIPPFIKGGLGGIIGERINPTGKKLLSAELKDGNVSIIRDEAMKQAEAGADILDINVGAPGTDEIKMMEKAVFAVQGAVNLPLMLDSNNPAVLEAGLKASDGKVIINSVNGEEKSLKTILPLAKKYGAAVLGLTLDGKGIPKTAGGRLKIAERILKNAVKIGIPREDVIFDCLTLTVSAEPMQGLETLKALRMVKDKFGSSTILGVSNVSFGLPARPLINSSFLSMALQTGLDAAIINPMDQRMMEAFHASLVLIGKDLRAERYIKKYSQQSAVGSVGQGFSLATGGIADKLKKAIIEGDKDRIAAMVEESLRDGMKPMDVSNNALIPGLEEVGRRFDKGIYFLPQVILSAETMQAAFGRLKKELKESEFTSHGKVVMATVQGDIHDIGKNIVCTLLQNHGFDVIDLGKNVPAKTIFEEARKAKADIVGLSALMTTTMVEMENVIKLFRTEGVDTLIMVGGAVLTKKYAEDIGADGYGKDAMDAVARAKELMKKT
ncbi:MAG: homocysteine S-methyltransferase family protein [Nitrospinae bacterium]|nr:homocysteine S-methyltransferase family protein [Nitrospinota bacterium]